MLFAPFWKIGLPEKEIKYLHNLETNASGKKNLINENCELVLNPNFAWTWRDQSAWHIDDLHEANRGNTRLSSTTSPQHISKRATRKKKEDPSVTQARAYINLQQANIDAWWQKQEASEKPPTTEQRQFIESVIP